MTRQELNNQVEEMRKSINQAWSDYNTKEEDAFEIEEMKIQTIKRWYVDEVKSSINLVEHCAELIEDIELIEKIRDIKITISYIDNYRRT